MKTGRGRVLAGAAVLILACFLILGLVAGKHPEEGTAVVMGVSFGNLADPWQQQLYQDLQVSLEGEDAALLTYDAAGSVVEQARNLQELADRQIDALIIVPIMDGDLGGQLERFKTDKVAVALLQSRVEGFEPDIFVHSDDLAAGEIAGSYLARVLGGRGILMEIAGDPDDPVSSARKAGFRSKTALYPDLKREYLVPGHYSGTFTEKTLISNGLTTAIPAPEGIFAHTDLMAFGAARAFREAGQKPVIIGINGLPGAMEGMDLVEKDLLSATIAYPTGGSMAAEALFKCLRGEPYQSEIRIQPVLHTGAHSPAYK